MRIQHMLVGVALAAAMNVACATNLFVGVDPATGNLTFMIGSGVGEVRSTQNSQAPGPGVVLLPSQQMQSYQGGAGAANGAHGGAPVDLDTFVQNAGPDIIEALIRNKAAIDRENAAFIEQQRALLSAGRQAQTLGIKDLSDLEKLQKNLDNIVGNIVKKAIEQNKVDPDRMRSLIEHANQGLAKKIDLASITSSELTEQEKAKREQIKLLEEERQKRQEAEKSKQEALKKEKEAMLAQLKEQAEKQKAEKEKAAEAAKQKAAEEYAKKLSDDAAKAAFEKKQQAREDEKQKQAAQDASERTGGPLPDSRGTQGSGGAGGDGGRAGGDAGLAAGSGGAGGDGGLPGSGGAGGDGSQGPTGGAGAAGDGGQGGLAGRGGAAGGAGGEGGQGGLAGQGGDGGRGGNGGPLAGSGGAGGDGGQAPAGGAGGDGAQGGLAGRGGAGAAGGQAGQGGAPGGAGGGIASGGQGDGGSGPQVRGPTGGSGSGGKPGGFDPKYLDLVGKNKLHQSQQKLGDEIKKMQDANKGILPKDSSGDTPPEGTGAQGDGTGEPRDQAGGPTGGAGDDPPAEDPYDPNGPVDSDLLHRLASRSPLPPITPRLPGAFQQALADQSEAGDGGPNDDSAADDASKDKLLRDFVEQIAAIEHFPYIKANHVSAEPPSESLRGAMSATYSGRLSGAFGDDGPAVSGALNLNVQFNTREISGGVTFDGGHGSVTASGGWSEGHNAVDVGLGGTAYGGAVEGWLNGQFYGPKGQELGGEWGMSVTDGSGVRNADGNFAVKQ